MRAGERFLRLFLAPRCAFCEAPLADEALLVCRSCLGSLPFRHPHPRIGWGAYEVLRPQELDPELVCPFWYQGPIRERLLAMKFAERWQVARALGPLLANALRQLNKQVDVLVPLPLARKRQSIRGFNQAERLATFCAEALNRGLENKLLLRVRETQRQSEMANQAARMANVAAAFAVNPQAQDYYRKARILLVDDVLTTGSTLFAAARALTDQKLKVTALVVASNQGR